MAEISTIEIIMYGADWCPDCQRAKKILEEYQIAFTYINVEIDKKSTQLVERINKGKRIIPTFSIGGDHYTNPDNNVLARLLGINENGRVVMYSADWCPDCRRAKSFLNDNGINYLTIDVEKYEWATKAVESINNGKRIIPTLLINHTAYTNPDNKKLIEVLKIGQERSDKIYDTIIIGGGATGLTTSIYAQRDRFLSVILEKKNIGGNTFLTEKIENYPGFNSISGPELMERMETQAKTYGAEIKTGVEVTSIRQNSRGFDVETTLGNFFGRSVVVAVGSTYRKLNIPGEDALIGSGVHFCATCDGAFYRDRDVAVVGGGNSALEEAIFLAGFCRKVKIIHRRSEFSASQTYIDKLESVSNIEIYLNQTPVEFTSGESNKFQGVKVRNNENSQERIIEADGVFVFIGLIPNTAFLKEVLELDQQGFVITPPGRVETNIQGIFAAGDCRKGTIAQVASATGEGVVASYALKNYLKN